MNLCSHKTNLKGRGFHTCLFICPWCFSKKMAAVPLVVIPTFWARRRNTQVQRRMTTSSLSTKNKDRMLQNSKTWDLPLSNPNSAPAQEKQEETKTTGRSNLGKNATNTYHFLQFPRSSPEFINTSWQLGRGGQIALQMMK